MSLPLGDATAQIAVHIAVHLVTIEASLSRDVKRSYPLMNGSQSLPHETLGLHCFMVVARKMTTVKKKLDQFSSFCFSLT